MSVLGGTIDRLRGLKQKIDLHETYVAVFSTPEGKRVLAHLAKVGGVTSSSFVQGDPHGTSFKEGQRHIVLSILRMVNRDTTKLIEQIEEGLKHEQDS